MKLNKAFEAEHVEEVVFDFGLGDVYTHTEFSITVEDDRFVARLVRAVSECETYSRNHLVLYFGGVFIEDLEERVASEYK